MAGQLLILVCQLLLSVGSEGPKAFSRNIKKVSTSFPFLSSSACK